MIAISIINVIIFIIICIFGLTFFIKNHKVAKEIIQININSRTISSFFLMFALGAMVMFLIFIVNLNLNFITVISLQNISILLKNIPNEFSIALIEELLFRGLIFVGILICTNRKIITLLLSSLIFCFLHSPDTVNSLTSYFLAGLMYGISYLKFKTIWAPTGLHFAWNYFQGIVFGFPVGTQISNSYFEIIVIDSKVWNGGDHGPEGSILGIFARCLIILSILIISFRLKGFLNAPDFLKFKTDKDNNLLNK